MDKSHKVDYGSSSLGTNFNYSHVSNSIYLHKKKKKDVSISRLKWAFCWFKLAMLDSFSQGSIGLFLKIKVVFVGGMFITFVEMF